MATVLNTNALTGATTQYNDTPRPGSSSKSFHGGANGAWINGRWHPNGRVAAMTGTEPPVEATSPGYPGMLEAIAAKTEKDPRSVAQAAAAKKQLVDAGVKQETANLKAKVVADVTTKVHADIKSEVETKAKANIEAEAKAKAIDDKAVADKVAADKAAADKRVVAPIVSTPIKPVVSASAPVKPVAITPAAPVQAPSPVNRNNEEDDA